MSAAVIQTADMTTPARSPVPRPCVAPNTPEVTALDDDQAPGMSNERHSDPSDCKSPTESDNASTGSDSDWQQLAQVHPCAAMFGPRMRKSPFFQRTIEHGVQGFAPYNHMLLPTHFSEGPEAEYQSLVNDVCIWDVGCERQVQLEGEDAGKLAQLLTCRYIGNMKPGQCRYALVCDDEGNVLNDPVLTKLAEDKYWFSIADTDILLYAKGIAIGRGLKVKVTEPDVSPLAIQGPKSLDVMLHLFGDWVKELKHFDCRPAELNGIPMVVARSGWSPELGYELYLQDGSRASELWDLVWKAGQPYRMRPGAPNQPRRIEGGLLSWGGDFGGFMESAASSALELCLPPFMLGALDRDVDFIGKEALLRHRAEGTVKRRLVGVKIDGGRLAGRVIEPWPVQIEDAEGAPVGKVTVVCYSPRLEATIGLAQVNSPEFAEPGTRITITLPDGRRVGAQVSKMPFEGTVSPLQKKRFDLPDSNDQKAPAKAP